MSLFYRSCAFLFQGLLHAEGNHHTSRCQTLPHIANETIRQVLHESGYSFQQTRTWCRTGYALRVRKSGTVTVYDLETPEKKDEASWRVSKQKPPASSNSMKKKPGRIRRSHNLVLHGSRKDIPPPTPMSTNAGELPNC